MTTFGTILLSAEEAVAWSDAELWNSSDRTVAGHAPKLAANPFLCAVGVGTGFQKINAEAAAAVSTARDFDDLVVNVTNALRKAVAARADIFDRRPSSFAGQVYAVAGWSHQAGRMLAWEFRAENFFAATLATRCMLPELQHVAETWKPCRPGDVIDVARGQMRALRESGLDAAGTGALTIAHLRRDYLSVQVVPDFDAEARAILDAEREQCLSMVI